VTAETEDDLIKRHNELKGNVENRGKRVNMNKTKVAISGEWQKVTQKAVRWPCDVVSLTVSSESTCNSMNIPCRGTRDLYNSTRSDCTATVLPWFNSSAKWFSSR